MREFERYGDRILLGGDRYESNKDFIEWAEAYDIGTRNGRSLAKHKDWLATVKCPVIEVINRELPLALEAIIYGDGEFFIAHPQLDNAPIWIYFDSADPNYNRFEYWGTPIDYK